MSRPDKEEQEILNAFDAGKLQRAPDIEERRARHQQYAEAMRRLPGGPLHCGLFTCEGVAMHGNRALLDSHPHTLYSARLPAA